ncbi:MAG: radical SAM protein [Desulfovibrionaceae bacterium]|nr:radical SAM protein [Desulfovibrionaceae bacterium]MBF0514103.1 radical SAM protein [Desulfovibrionaceae bacterium]
MDKYKIDSHKLNYHVGRLAGWLSGETVYPIYMELSPAGACNHRCVFCGLDFMQYRGRFLETATLKERLAEMGRLGVKAIMYAGEGEPFLHRDMADIILHTKACGIDAALTTNGVLMRPEKSERILGSTEWIKVSCNAGTPEAYAKIHRTDPGDFRKAVDNMAAAVKIRNEKGYSCAIGLQIVLLPENKDTVEELTRIAKDIGLNYIVVKPYSQHPQSNTDCYQDIRYKQYEDLAETLGSYADENFGVVVRLAAMRKWDAGLRPYEKCLALPFWSYIDAEGNVWGCSVYLKDERFLYGNIYQESFEAIWTGDRRTKSLEWFESQFDPSVCRVNCRMDEINRYLWELKNPPHHVNFI